jgi:hypothetical protein
METDCISQSDKRLKATVENIKQADCFDVIFLPIELGELQEYGGVSENIQII